MSILELYVSVDLATFFLFVGKEKFGWYKVLTARVQNVPLRDWAVYLLIY